MRPWEKRKSIEFRWKCKGKTCYSPEEFEELKNYGLELGFKWVESAPLVRSSYHAAEQVRALQAQSQGSEKVE